MVERKGFWKESSHRWHSPVVLLPISWDDADIERRLDKLDCSKSSGPPFNSPI